MISSELLILFAIVGLLIGVVYSLRRIYLLERLIMSTEKGILRVEKIKATKGKKKTRKKTIRKKAKKKKR